MKSPEYIVYQVLSKGPGDQDILSYPLILHNDTGKFGIICMWAKGHKIGKKLTRGLIKTIYINSLDDSKNLLNTSSIKNKKDVFSLSSLKERRNKIYEMWGWRRLMYYLEI